MGVNAMPESDFLKSVRCMRAELEAQAHHIQDVCLALDKVIAGEERLHGIHSHPPQDQIPGPTPPADPAGIPAPRVSPPPAAAGGERVSKSPPATDDPAKRSKPKPMIPLADHVARVVDAARPHGIRPRGVAEVLQSEGVRSDLKWPKLLSSVAATMANEKSRAVKRYRMEEDGTYRAVTFRLAGKP